MGSATYLPAPTVAATASALIAEHHQHLIAAPIVYVFRSPASRSRNRIVLGRAVRVLGLNAFLVAAAAGEATDDLFEATESDYSFFVMEIALEQWDDAPPPARVALVDHELCHFNVDTETGELRIRAHDIEEFNAVVARHGPWSTDVTAFLESCATS